MRETYCHKMFSQVRRLLTEPTARGLAEAVGRAVGDGGSVAVDPVSDQVFYGEVNGGAPISTSIRVQLGPASAREKSSTRIPDKTCSIPSAILNSFAVA